MAIGCLLLAPKLSVLKRPQLNSFVFSGRPPRSLACHGRLVEWPTEACATKRVDLVLNGSTPTAGKWCQHFVDHRVADLYDESRPGRPPSISDEQVAILLRRIIKQKPTVGTR